MNFFKIAPETFPVTLLGGENYLLEEFEACENLEFSQDLEAAGIVPAPENGTISEEDPLAPIATWSSSAAEVFQRWMPRILDKQVDTSGNPLPEQTPLGRDLRYSEKGRLISWQLSLNGHWQQLGERQRLARRTANQTLSAPSQANTGAGS